MKSRLNILSLLIVLVFVYAAGYEVYLANTDFKQGFREGYSSVEVNDGLEVKTPGVPYYIKLGLDTEGYMPVDSIYSKTTEKYYKVEYTSMKFYPHQEASSLYNIASMISSFAMMIIFFILIIAFWKVISSVKRAVIFERCNIRRLRIIGFCFALIALLSGILEFIVVIETKKLITIDGYSILSGEWFASSLWIYALISFLIAEIFAIGLRLKEEQELTI